MSAVTYRIQYLQDDRDITAEIYADKDADAVRLWSGAHGDVCLAELSRDDHGNGYFSGGWVLTSTELTWPDEPDWREYDTPEDALTAILRGAPSRLAVCACGLPGAACDD
jgi:hypothetical protein